MVVLGESGEAGNVAKDEAAEAEAIKDEEEYEVAAVVVVAFAGIILFFKAFITSPLRAKPPNPIPIYPSEKGAVISIRRTSALVAIVVDEDDEDEELVWVSDHDHRSLMLEKRGVEIVASTSFVFNE